jgi:hypothetical protein
MVSLSGEMAAAPCYYPRPAGLYPPLVAHTYPCCLHTPPSLSLVVVVLVLAVIDLPLRSLPRDLVVVTCSTRCPPCEQLLAAVEAGAVLSVIGVGVGVSSSSPLLHPRCRPLPRSSPSGPGVGVDAGSSARWSLCYLVVVVVLFHPVSSCSRQWMWFPHHPCCSPFPPHEQLLVAAVRGAA